MKHPLNKYIGYTRSQLESLPQGNTQAYDTSQLQLMCLEKFANHQGYHLVDGLFVTDQPSARVMTLDRMVQWYNDVVPHIADGRSPGSTHFIETVYLRGRNLRRPVKVQQHWVKFL